MVETLAIVSQEHLETKLTEEEAAKIKTELTRTGSSGQGRQRYQLPP